MRSGPLRALRVVALSIRDFYEEMFLFVPLNLVWWVAAVLLLPLPPVAAGLYYISHRIVHEQRVGADFFKEAARDFLWPSVRLALLDLAILSIIVVNLFFYSQFTNWIQLITILWIYGLILWLGLQLYLFPLLFEQQEPKALTAVRNAIILVLTRPLYTLIILVLALILTAVSFVLPVLLVLAWPGVMTLIGARALATILEEIRAAPPQQGDQAK